MKTSNQVLAIAVLLSIAIHASARETGTINQAGAYEASMQFYLHPAHGFPGKAEERNLDSLVSNVRPSKPASGGKSVASEATDARSTQNPRRL